MKIPSWIPLVGSESEDSNTEDNTEFSTPAELETDNTRIGDDRTPKQLEMQTQGTQQNSEYKTPSELEDKTGNTNIGYQGTPTEWKTNLTLR